MCARGADLDLGLGLDLDLDLDLGLGLDLDLGLGTPFRVGLPAAQTFVAAPAGTDGEPLVR